MKRIFFVLLINWLVVSVTVAQSPARMREIAQKAVQQQVQATQVSERAQLEFPGAADMPEDVSWRRDIYRVLDLTKDCNAVLYYPEEPQGERMNLFTYLFKLMMRKQITVYNYTIDGNEDFSADNIVKPKDFLDRNHIRYEEKDGHYHIEDSDIPSSEVNTYYIKECAYFDQHTATFHIQVVALCPVRKETDDFDVAAVNKPMFWVKYADISPFLAKLSLNGSNYNNAATMSADDYFTTNQYEGKIYKTNNLQGRVLANYCKTDSDITKEQKRIEKELATFEEHVWGTDSSEIKKVSTENITKNSVVVTQGTLNVTSENSSKRLRSIKSEDSNSSRSQLKRQKASSSTRATYSVRRQRH